MFGIGKKTVVMPWYVPALANLTAVWVIYRIARSFTSLAGKRIDGNKRKIKRGTIRFKIKI